MCNYLCQILTQPIDMSKLLGSYEFSSISGRLGKRKYSRTNMGYSNLSQVY